MSKLDRLNAFISVVELQGFYAAAKKLGLSAAAISRQISALENDLGS
jgi:DNA-binding transcriptional LysR family regulator